MAANQELYYQVPEQSAMPFTQISISLALMSLIWSHNGVNFWTMISQQLQNFMSLKVVVLNPREMNVIIFLLVLIVFTILLMSLVFQFIDQSHFAKKMEKLESTLISIPILLMHLTFMDITMKLLYHSENKGIYNRLALIKCYLLDIDLAYMPFGCLPM